MACPKCAGSCLQFSLHYHPGKGFKAVDIVQAIFEGCHTQAKDRIKDYKLDLPVATFTARNNSQHKAQAISTKEQLNLVLNRVRDPSKYT